jgi:hypothetical protein
LKRITAASRIAKYICFGFLFFSIGFNLLFLIRFSAASNATPWHELPVAAFQIIFWLWSWKLFQVFRGYERGRIFAEETIGSVKTLGVLYVVGWLLLTALHFLRQKPALTQTAPPPGVTLMSGPTQITQITSQTKINYRMGFFTFNFGTEIDVGPLLAGAGIILIAWVMEEGRKIQEEQALTV